MKVSEAKASPASSSIGYPQEQDTDGKEKKRAIYAGEKLILKPQLRDQYGNVASAPEGSVTRLIEAPDGPSFLTVKPQKKGDAVIVGAYEVIHESTLCGEYTMHIELDGMPLGGSPGVFFVRPALPTAAKSKLNLPTEPTVTGSVCVMMLVAYDKQGNQLDRGGARVEARVVGPNAGPCTVEDKKNGEYSLSFTAGTVGEYRVIARLDNVEMAPVPLQFAQGESKEVVPKPPSPGNDSPGKSPGKKKKAAKDKDKDKDKEGSTHAGSEHADGSSDRDETPEGWRDGTPASRRAGDEDLPIIEEQLRYGPTMATSSIRAPEPRYGPTMATSSIRQPEPRRAPMRPPPPVPAAAPSTLEPEVTTRPEPARASLTADPAQEPAAVEDVVSAHTPGALASADSPRRQEAANDSEDAAGEAAAVIRSRAAVYRAGGDVYRSSTGAPPAAPATAPATAPASAPVAKKKAPPPPPPKPKAS